MFKMIKIAMLFGIVLFFAGISYSEDEETTVVEEYHEEYTVEEPAEKTTVEHTYEASPVIEVTPDIETTHTTETTIIEEDVPVVIEEVRTPGVLSTSSEIITTERAKTIIVEPSKSAGTGIITVVPAPVVIKKPVTPAKDSVSKTKIPIKKVPLKPDPGGKVIPENEVKK